MADPDHDLRPEAAPEERAGEEEATGEETIVCPFTVRVSPEEVRPSDPVTLTFALTDAAAAGPLVGLDIVVAAADGAECGRVAIALDEDRVPAIEPLEIDAPAAPGLHRWRARLDLPEPGEGEEPLEVGTDLEVTVAAHRPSVTVWDLPPVVEAGRPFRLRLGIKCPHGCPSAGWGFVVRDAGGQEVARGAVGEETWPGTAGLHHAELALTAPAAPGLVVWTLEAEGRTEPCAHVAHAAALRLNVGRPAEHRLRIAVVDGVTGAPVARARVVAHPYRAMTDALGVAELAMPAGRYRLVVSGKPYFAMSREAELAGDLDLRVEMQVDREFGVEDEYV